MEEEKNLENPAESHADSGNEGESSEDIADEAPPTDEEWASRVLCSDESCIGVIGPDGRCKECGKPYEGELPDFETVSQEVERDAQPEPEPEEPFAGEPDEEKNGDDDDWSARKLCSDGNCIGVIDPGGKCKECGKPYQGDPTYPEHCMKISVGCEAILCIRHD